MWHYYLKAAEIVRRMQNVDRIEIITDRAAQNNFKSEEKDENEDSVTLQRTGVIKIYFI